MKNELPYWLALAHLPKIKTRKKNEIIVRLFEKGKTIIDFFNEQPSVWNNEYGIVEFEIDLFKQACKELSNYAFMVEDLLEQGYYIIPITSKEYSPTLKKNLGRTHAPPVLYAKGNLQILKEQSVAIVGSRKADDISLKFTDNVAKNASLSYKVVVSGFAKGVDKQALDSALKYNGQSIITLPQGITTFKSGFKKYYKKIVGGNLLVLSTFFPKAPWSVQLAMARNPIIYGLASEIYVAE
jgi:DNA processing protein